MQHDYSNTTGELTETGYRKLDIEVKRPGKMAGVLWLAAGVAFAVFFLLMTWISFLHR